MDRSTRRRGVHGRENLSVRSSSASGRFFPLSSIVHDEPGENPVRPVAFSRGEARDAESIASGLRAVGRGAVSSAGSREIRERAEESFLFRPFRLYEGKDNRMRGAIVCEIAHPSTWSSSERYVSSLKRALMKVDSCDFRGGDLNLCNWRFLVRRRSVGRKSRAPDVLLRVLRAFSSCGWDERLCREFCVRRVNGGPNGKFEFEIDVYAGLLRGAQPIDGVVAETGGATADPGANGPRKRGGKRGN